MNFGYILKTEVRTLSSFGDRLKEARKAKKLTQRQLAEMLGTTNTAVSNWENGTNTPTFSMLDKMSQILDINPARSETPDMSRGAADAEHIKKYRQLSPNGQRAVDALIDELLTYEAGYITDR